MNFGKCGDPRCPNEARAESSEKELELIRRRLQNKEHALLECQEKSYDEVKRLREALGVAARGLEIASDWNCNEVQCDPPKGWGLEAIEEDPGTGWCSTSQLASYLLAMSRGEK